jgi:cytidylate kinase
MSENNRFLEKYGVDCADMKNFDLVIDTSERTPEQVVEEILKHVRV